MTAANTSCAWYETFGERIEQKPLDFAMSYMTRSGRIPRDRLRKIAPEFMAAYEALRPEIADPVTDDTPARVKSGSTSRSIRTALPSCGTTSTVTRTRSR